MTIMEPLQSGLSFYASPSHSTRLEENHSYNHQNFARKSLPSEAEGSPSSESSSPFMINSNAAYYSSPSPSLEAIRCKRKLTGTIGYTDGQPVQAQRRNERERNRVKLVNSGFNTLRQHVPNGAKNKKMSKVETLRSAVEYIRELQKVLGALEPGESASGSPHLPLALCGTNENRSPSDGSVANVSPTSSASTSTESYCRSLAVPITDSSPSQQSFGSPSPPLSIDSKGPFDASDRHDKSVPNDEDLLSFSKWFSW